MLWLAQLVPVDVGLDVCLHKNPPILLRTDERKRSQASESQIVVTSFSRKLGKMSLRVHSLKLAYSRRLPG